MNAIEVVAGFCVAEVYGRVLDRAPPLGSLAELRGPAAAGRGAHPPRAHRNMTMLLDVIVGPDAETGHRPRRRPSPAALYAAPKTDALKGARFSIQYSCDAPCRAMSAPKSGGAVIARQAGDGVSAMPPTPGIVLHRGK
jgi:hypothetical protein